jgi:RNA polymerase sigma-70 factor (ECF subfamily)
VTPAGRHDARFRTTRWSLVRAAGGGAAPGSREALEELCRTYWYPLYAYARRAGHGAEDAQDLVQGFFARFLARNYLAGLDESARFRSYLLGALRNHRANEGERARALKRGGGEAPLSIDLCDAEQRYAREPADPATPERLYARKWALTVLERVLERLRLEQEELGRAALFERLRPFLVASETGESLAGVARELGLGDSAARVAVHRLRTRYRELLLQEVAHTVDRPQDVEDELRELFAALEGA